MALRPWRRTDKFNPKRMNQSERASVKSVKGAPGILVRRIETTTDAPLLIRPVGDQIIPASGSGSGGAGIEEVVVEKTIRQCPPGACSEKEQANFDTLGPHLKAYAIAADGSFPGQDTEDYLPILPNRRHPIAEFSGVVWNMVTGPTYTVFAGDKGWTMIFLEGLKLVNPPLQNELCQPFEPPDSEDGVCCLGTLCLSAENSGGAANCVDGGGVWMAGVPDCGFGGENNPCGGDLGACCLAEGECQILAEAVCVGMNGTFQGFGVSCEPTPCVGTGACCCSSFSTFAGCTEENLCFERDELSCGNTGDFYQGDGVPCPGACS